MLRKPFITKRKDSEKRENEESESDISYRPSKYAKRRPVPKEAEEKALETLVLGGEKEIIKTIVKTEKVHFLFQINEIIH